MSIIVSELLFSSSSTRIGNSLKAKMIGNVAVTTMEQREFEEMRLPEVETYLDQAETPTVLVPVGTTEQHGQHLALNTEYTHF